MTQTVLLTRPLQRRHSCAHRDFACDDARGGERENRITRWPRQRQRKQKDGLRARGRGARQQARESEAARRAHSRSSGVSKDTAQASCLNFWHTGFFTRCSVCVEKFGGRRVCVLIYGRPSST